MGKQSMNNMKRSMSIEYGKYLALVIKERVKVKHYFTISTYTNNDYSIIRSWAADFINTILFDPNNVTTLSFSKEMDQLIEVVITSFKLNYIEADLNLISRYYER